MKNVRQNQNSIKTILTEASEGNSTNDNFKILIDAAPMSTRPILLYYEKV